MDPTGPTAFFEDDPHLLFCWKNRYSFRLLERLIVWFLVPLRLKMAFTVFPCSDTFGPIPPA